MEDISQTTDDVPLQHHEMHTCDTSKLQKPVFLLFLKICFHTLIKVFIILNLMVLTGRFKCNLFVMVSFHSIWVFYYYQFITFEAL